ncbi:MAG: GNAT family N-acetyltransferase [Chitinophagaceae bacterium]|nr:MAG: GNAT family N-acetyltransferase [Chitinophagaceae bacterium]
MESNRDNLQFRAALSGDAAALYALAKSEGGNERLDPQFLRHWYFENPSGSFSIESAWQGPAAVGMATSNNFRFRIDGAHRLVAMPQNVVTARAARGKGLFSKLYFRTEAANRAAGADTFLTFTNALSTPIFLEKFGYRRAHCPDVLLYPFNPLALFARLRFRSLAGLHEMTIGAVYQPENALQKDAAWFAWRYASYRDGMIRLVEVADGSNVLGTLLFKKEKKKGLPFLLLMDVVASSEEDIRALLQAAPAAASRMGAPFLLMYDAVGVKAGGLHLRIRNRFNLLVKGRDVADTAHLARTDFNLFFGDMDIV